MNRVGQVSPVCASLKTAYRNIIVSCLPSIMDTNTTLLLQKKNLTSCALHKVYKKSPICDMYLSMLHSPSRLGIIVVLYLRQELDDLCSWLIALGYFLQERRGSAVLEEAERPLTESMLQAQLDGS